MLDTISLFAMVGVLAVLLHVGGVVSLSPQPMVQAMMGESPIVRAEIEQRELERAMELAQQKYAPARLAMAGGR
ncbi:hypothetical protein ACERK3_08380 [Phycisphaerales bacterium AB-hyl4]|uniref:Uncharacterized protein n=1 Tax=Natronomicrosphaera hydrolytica TaxID=3242702 RepID=A0ABV4U457_9BACT